MKPKIKFKIKPCRLCGTNSSIIKSLNNHFHVVCNKGSTIDNICENYIGLIDNCNKVIWHDSEQEAIHFWNENN